MRAIANVSLDAWLFGEDKQSDDAPATTSLAAPRQSLGVSSVAPSPAPGQQQQPPQPQQQSQKQPPAKLSLFPMAPAGFNLSGPSVGSANGGSQGNGDLSYPFPVSSKLRKLFRPNRLQWNRTRLGSREKREDKKRQLVGLSTESFQRLQGHVPFTLKEVVKDPKKLPFLLRWLSSDTEGGSAPRTSYHQVLLFLLEIEQLLLVAEDKRHDQALKIWNKYLDTASEFQISSTLELTPELVQLVRDSIDDPEKVLDAFFPVQKLAYMRLTREEMPRFLKSDEYLHMLTETGDATEAVPMERILQQPRAAHYFLLFLMQSRQHFELYFWMHVEYVLKPVLEQANYQLFWRLAHVLVEKAQNDSQAITLATKNDLYLAIEGRRFDEQLHPPQPVAKALFSRAQQEIFVMLRSSWFDRFMKSNLYKVALKDSLIQLQRDDSKEDSPPKLLSRAFSSAEYFAANTIPGSERDDDGDNSLDEEQDEHSGNAGTSNSINSSSDLVKRIIPTKKALSTEARRPTTDRLDRDGDGSEDDASDFSSDDSEEAGDKVVLNLESIIRLTKLPDGLQVHYRPNYDMAVNSDGSELDGALDWIVTFATFVEKQTGEEAAATLMLMPVSNPNQPSVDSFDDISRRIKMFLVPDDRVLIKRAGASDPGPGDMLFPFQQSGPNGFLFGSVFLTYEPVRVGTSNEEFFTAKGFCLLSRLPLVNSLRVLVEHHVTSAKEQADIFDCDRLKTLFQADFAALRSSGGVANDANSSDPQQHSLRNAAKHSSVLGLPLNALNATVDVSVTRVFDHLGTALTLQVLASALLESSVVFVSRQYSLLTACAEAVRNLLRPFSWCHVYAPVLPKPLLSYLQCPTPILVGIHSDYAHRSDMPNKGFYLIADLDRHVVEYVGNHSVGWKSLGLVDDGHNEVKSQNEQIYLPACFEAAKHRLDKILTPQDDQYDSIGGFVGMAARQRRSSRPSNSSIDDQVRVVCLDLFSELLHGHSSACLVVGDTKESVVIFDETQFLSTRNEQDLPFYRALMRTQCFSEIVSAHRINLSVKEHDFEELEVDDPGDLQEGII